MLTSTLGPSRIKPPLQREHDLSKKSLFAICINFSLILVPTCLHFPSQNPLKSHQNSTLEGIDFWFDFCIVFFFIDVPSIWDANLEPMLALRCAQDDSETPPRRLPRRSARQFSILIEFWSILGRLLFDFWLILARCLFDFPSIFGQVSGWCFARFLIKRSTIFYLLARFLVDCSSAVAGTQLCCALDNIFIF